MLLSLSTIHSNIQTQIITPSMAVEATHLNLFNPQLIQDRELMNVMNQGNGNVAAYNPQQMRFLGISSAAAMPENQFYNQAAVCEGKTSLNTDSGLTYNIPAPRKRSRADAFNQFHPVQNYTAAPPQKGNGFCQLPSLPGDDMLPQIQQYQFDIDAIISQHTKKIRMELEERQKHQGRMLAAAIGEGVMKKLREKDEQIQRVAKLNLALQERVKSLYVENQLWRDLAQTNEATANSLRSNLEQVLQHVGGEDQRVSPAAVEDDAESCCGSCDGEKDAALVQDNKEEGSSSCQSDRRCKLCGERESSVLLLPCRHLCLCNVCGSGSQQVQSCPCCNASVTATLHVNIS